MKYLLSTLCLVAFTATAFSVQSEIKLENTNDTYFVKEQPDQRA